MNLSGIAFIASVIERRLISGGQIHCSFCRLVFDANVKIGNSLYLSNSKRVCKSTFEICKIANNALKKCIASCNVRNLSETVCINVLANLNHQNMYPLFFEPEQDESHKYFFLKYIISEFIHLKCTHKARKRTQECHKEYFRRRLMKNIYFRGQ